MSPGSDHRQPLLDRGAAAVARRGRRPGLVALGVVVLLVTATAAAASPVPAPGSLADIHGPSPSTKVKNGLAKSPNWSGYAVTGPTGTFTSVSGSWVQPTASCPVNQAQGAAFWVGIDGFATSQVEQIGTDSDCNKGTKKVKGGPHYYAWWEIDTASSTSSVTIPDTVCPGDQLSATVTDSGGAFNLSITDTSVCGSSWNFNHAASLPSAPASSAEWIAEAPSVCKSKCTPEKLADFGTVGFGGATANGTAVSAYPASQTKEIVMAKGKTIKAEPSGLSGSSFSVTWAHN